MKSYDKVIFVSKGNTFSSPLVEAIYRMKAPNWLPNSMSRGTVVLFSEPINPKVNVLLSSHDMNISNHENSKQLKREEITADTLLLTMTFSDKLKVIEDLGVSNNVYTVGEYIEDDADIREGVRILLESENYCVEEAEKMMQIYQTRLTLMRHCMINF